MATQENGQETWSFKKEDLDLQTTKSKIKEWAKNPENGNCEIKIKTSSSEQNPKTIDEIAEKTDLENLHTELTKENSQAKTKCDESTKANKPMIAEKGSGTTWTFKKEGEA